MPCPASGDEPCGDAARELPLGRSGPEVRDGALSQTTLQLHVRKRAAAGAPEGGTDGEAGKKPARSAAAAPSPAPAPVAAAAPADPLAALCLEFPGHDRALLADMVADQDGDVHEVQLMLRFLRREDERTAARLQRLQPAPRRRDTLDARAAAGDAEAL